MHAVRTGIGQIQKEASRQLTLNIDVILLDISVFSVEVWRQRGGTIRGNESRYVGLRISSGRQQNSSGAERATIVSAGETGKACTGQCAVLPIQRTERCCVELGGRRIIKKKKVYDVVIGIKPKRDEIRNKKDTLATPDHSLLVKGIRKTKS